MNNNHKKILIVDDDEGFSKPGSRSLKKRLYAHIMSVDNSEDAINAAKTFTYDLILLDINIPGRNGFEILKEIRKFSDVKVFMVSGLDKNKLLPEQMEVIDTQTSGFIHKPYTMDEMVSKIVKILGSEVSIDPLDSDLEDMKGRPEAKEIYHDINVIHGHLRISCDEYFYAKEKGIYKDKKSDEMVEILEAILEDMADYVALEQKVLKRIKTL